jgi:hypothetical protein
MFPAIHISIHVLEIKKAKFQHTFLYVLIKELSFQQRLQWQNDLAVRRFWQLVQNLLFHNLINLLWKYKFHLFF